MITSIKIKNFQSHANTALDFCPNINSLVGVSNSGKSAVLRAISWVVNNRPAGDSVISNFIRDEKGNPTDTCEVTICTEKDVVQKIRDKINTTYILNGKKFEAVGLDVPDEIQNAFNLNEINIQTQLDTPFLLSKSPGEIARFFNKIVHLDKIDKYLTLAESKKRQTRTDLDLAKTNHENLSNELKKYSWIPKAKEMIAQYNTLNKQNEELKTKINYLQTTIHDYIEYKKILKNTEIVSKADALIQQITTYITQQNQLTVQIKKLSTAINNYITYQTLLNNTSFIPTAEIIISTKIIPNLQLAKTNQQKIAFLKKTISDYTTAQQTLKNSFYIEQSEKLISKIQKLTNAISTIQNQKTKLKSTIINYTQYKKEQAQLTQSFNELKKMLPNTCPLCGAILTDKHIEDLV